MIYILPPPISNMPIVKRYLTPGKTKNAGDIIISHKYDKLSKLSCRIFANSLLRFIGEKPGIKNIYTYEIYTPTHKLKIMDLVVETANGYCIDFEFHKLNTTEEIILRNIQYVVNFRLENGNLIKPYIISMADAERSIRKAKISPDLEIEIPFIFFKNYDGDDMLEKIKNKIGKNISIEEFDLFHLIFIPFMKHKKSDCEITKELIGLVNEMDLTQEQQYQIKACQIILVDIFIPEKEKEKQIKVVNMGSTFLEEYERKLVENAEKKAKKEGKEEGKEIGKEEEKKEFARKLKEDNIPKEKIMQYTGLSLNVINSL